MKSWIQSWTGKAVYLAHPRTESICIADIAHAISNINRYTGHTFEPYSVAEHSIRVAAECSNGFRDRSMALVGLMHDATEAYLGDVSKPLKMLLGAAYTDLEDNMAEVIGEKFFPDTPHILRHLPDAVKRADLVLLATEKRDFLGPPPEGWGELPPPQEGVIEKPLHHRQAEVDFLRLFKQLCPAGAAGANESPALIGGGP